MPLSNTMGQKGWKLTNFVPSVFDLNHLLFGIKGNHLFVKLSMDKRELIRVCFLNPSNVSWHFFIYVNLFRFQNQVHKRWKAIFRFSFSHHRIQFFKMVFFFVAIHLNWCLVWFMKKNKEKKILKKKSKFAIYLIWCLVWFMKNIKEKNLK